MNFNISFKKKFFKEIANVITGIGYSILILSIGYGFLGSVPKNTYDDFSSYLVMGKNLGGEELSEVNSNKSRTSSEDKIGTYSESQVSKILVDYADGDKALNVYSLYIANKKSIQHLTFTGKVKGGGKVIVYLGVSSSRSSKPNEGIVSKLQGFYVESGRFLTKLLVGQFMGTNLQSALDNQKVELHELVKKSGQLVTNRVMALSKGSRYWFASGAGMVMRLLPYKLKLAESFNYNRRAINPQSLFIMLEEVQGYNLAVDLRTRNDRPFQTAGNWQMVNLEYGYVRYQVLGQQGNVWTLATELDKADGNPSVMQIIKVVRVNNILVLAEEIDSDENGYSKLSSESLQTNGAIVSYNKSYSERGTIGLLKGLRAYIKNHSLNSEILPIIEDINKEDLDTNLCNGCARVTVQYQYDSVKEVLMPNKVISEPVTAGVYSSENYFRNFVEKAHDGFPTVSTLDELEKLLGLWSSTYNNLP